MTDGAFSVGGQKNDSLTIKTFYVDKENEVIKKLNDLNDSIDKLHKNVQSKPTTVDGYIKLASALAAVGHTEEALSAYESALKIQPVRNYIRPLSLLSLDFLISYFYFLARIFLWFELIWETFSSLLVVWKKLR